MDFGMVLRLSVMLIRRGLGHELEYREGTYYLGLIMVSAHCIVTHSV